MNKFEKTCNKISKLKAENNHGAALSLGCELMGDTGLHLKELVDHVNAIVELENHLPNGLRVYRDSLYDRMLKTAEYKLSESDYELFYNSF